MKNKPHIWKIRNEKWTAKMQGCPIIASDISPVKTFQSWEEAYKRWLNRDKRQSVANA